MADYRAADLKELEELLKGGGEKPVPGPARAATPAAPKAYADPGAITQSYYKTPVNASNYEAGRPVYEQSQAVQDAANQLAQHEQNKPGAYQSQYGDQIQAMIDQMLNRDKFQYDFAADPLYRQYAEKYQQQGKRAMRDSMGQAAALTGGYGNSYAQTVGQQAYQGYLESLNDVIPGLRDAAYQAYLNEGDAMRQNLQMLQTQDAADYGKYRDSVSDYRGELDYFYAKFSDMSQQEYNRYQNDAAAWEADRAYWYQRQQDQQAQQNWQAEFNLALQQAAASRRGGGSGGKMKSGQEDARIPTSYKEFAALTGQGGIMTEREFARRNGSGKDKYQDYLNKMWAKYN